MALRKSQFWFDNSSGTLKDYSDDLHSVHPKITREILEDTGLNDDYMQRVAVGLKDGTIALGGYIRSGNTGIVKALEAAYNSTGTKTWQWLRGGRYLNGEGIIDGVDYGEADGHGLIMWSCNLFVDGTVNNTSVAL